MRKMKYIIVIFVVIEIIEIHYFLTEPFIIEFKIMYSLLSLLFNVGVTSLFWLYFDSKKETKKVEELVSVMLCCDYEDIKWYLENIYEKK